MCFCGPYVTSVLHTARIGDMKSHAGTLFQLSSFRLWAVSISPNLKNAQPLPSYTWDPERRKANISHPIGYLLYWYKTERSLPYKGVQMLLVECWNSSSIIDWHHNSVSSTINTWPLVRSINVRVSYRGYCGLHGLYLGHLKLSPPPQPIAWKPNTIATRTLVFTTPPIFRGSILCCNQLLIGAAIEHFYLYFTTLG